jgi:AcrR family transcriptional regulator
MDSKKRREREKEKLRQQILNAARTISLEDGWHAVTIRKIAKKIEYTPPTIYEYFRNKDDIFYTLLRMGYQKLYYLFVETYQTIPDPKERLFRLGTTYWNFAWEYKELYQVMNGLNGVRFGVESIPNEAKDIYSLLKKAVEELLQQYQQPLENAHHQVVLLWATLHGLISLTMTKQIAGGIEQGKKLCHQAIQQWIDQSSRLSTINPSIHKTTS